MNPNLRWMLAVSLAGLCIPWITTVRAAWTEPKDGALTEKEVVSYLKIATEQAQEAIATMAAVQKNPNLATEVARLQAMDDHHKAALAREGLTEEEFKYVANKVIGIHGVLMVQSEFETHRWADVQNQIKDRAKELADAKAEQAAWEAAQKQGKRMMSADERAAATKQATDDAASIADEIKQCADEAKSAADDAVKADADVKAALAAAAHPPADVAEADRPDFIKGKNDEADAARSAAKDARDKQTEAIKAQAEAQSRQDAAKRKAANPDVPVTDDEKADVKKADEEGVAAAKEKVTAAQTAYDQTQANAKTARKVIDDLSATESPANIEIVKKHSAEVEAFFKTLQGGK